MEKINNMFSVIFVGKHGFIDENGVIIIPIIQDKEQDAVSLVSFQKYVLH